MSNDTPPTIALIGDSHSLVLYEALSAKHEDETIINIAKWSCLPFVTGSRKRGNCKLYQSELNTFLNSNPQIHTIILSGYWGYLASGGFSKKGNGYRIHEEISAANEEMFIENASGFLNLHQENVENIIVIEDVPDLDFPPVRCEDIGAYRFLRSDCFMSYQDFKPRREKVRNLLKKLMQRHPDLGYVEVVHIFCDEEKCTSMNQEGTLYSDSDHVSRLGADLISEQIINLNNE
jgi:hypothetical protein